MHLINSIYLSRVLRPLFPARCLSLLMCAHLAVVVEDGDHSGVQVVCVVHGLVPVVVQEGRGNKERREEKEGR